MNELEQKEFDELSAIVKSDGYMSLDTQEKRKRYSELKKKVDGDNDKVTLSKNELQAMIDKSINAYKAEAKKHFETSTEGLEEARQIGKWIKSKQPKKLNSTASLRVYRQDGISEGGVIIDWRYLKKAFNEDTRKYDVLVYQIDVHYGKDDVRQHEVTLANWVEINEFEKVEIIKQDVEEEEYSDGIGYKAFTKGGYAYANPNFFGVKSEGLVTGDSFDFKVYRKSITCTVKRPNGDVLTVDSSKLNQ